jgi:hypothetical protein
MYVQYLAHNIYMKHLTTSPVADGACGKGRHHRAYTVYSQFSLGPARQKFLFYAILCMVTKG